MSRMSMRRALWLIPLVAFVVLVVMLWGRLGRDPMIVPQATTGQAFPAFRLNSLTDSGVLTEASLPRQPFLLNVWGSWCPTCAAEQPYLMHLATQGVMMVGVNYKDQTADALSYLSARGNPFVLNLQDARGDLGVDLGVTGAPETFVVNADHRIMQHVIGEIDDTVWQRQLKPCLDSLRVNQGGNAACH